jgi:hypothetical protein
VSGIAAADLVVGGIVNVSAHVSGLDVGHAGEALEDSFNTPETSAAEDRCLLVGHDC